MLANDLEAAEAALVDFQLVEASSATEPDPTYAKVAPSSPWVILDRVCAGCISEEGHCRDGESVRDCEGVCERKTERATGSGGIA